MGGGGDYYDRDVTPTYNRQQTGKGYSNIAEELTSRTNADPSLFPLDRSIRTLSKYPVGWIFDETGSMGKLPKILVDKAAMVVGEVSRNRYLDAPEFCVAAVGDVEPGAEEAPVQVGEFCVPKSLDEWFKRIYLEGKGGGQARESYELMAFFWANKCDMPNATCPILIITGDEGFRETIPTKTLNVMFGGTNESVTAKQVFKTLLEKFKGNVVHIRRDCSDGYGPALNKKILKQWTETLGEGRIVALESDLAIGDLVVGTIALLSGSRTLVEYMEDVRNRPLTLGNTKFEPQSPERIAEIERALVALDGYCEEKFGGKRGRGSKYDLTPMFGDVSLDDVLPKKVKKSKAEKEKANDKPEKSEKTGKKKPGKLFS
ncbi:MAG: hypothetical protein HY226_01200 [Candidatus Vogelbacteria bacterium]|nr:hypothetical protein [Candidatus Vogelbacteria bacterium]